LSFTASDPVDIQVGDGVSAALAETLAAYRSGATTADLLMKAIPTIRTADAARQRLSRVRRYLDNQEAAA